MSAATRDLKAGVVAEPVVGPAKTVLAAVVSNVIANVPEDVIDEVDVIKKEGTDKPTLVTVPPLVPPVEAEIVMLPFPFVMVTFVPAVRVDFVREPVELLPINN